VVFALMPAVVCRARPGARCSDHRRAHGGTVHPRHHAARLSLDAGHPEHLSRTPHLGTIGDATCARRIAQFIEAAGDGLETCGELLKIRSDTKNQHLLARRKY